MVRSGQVLDLFAKSRSGCCSGEKSMVAPRTSAFHSWRGELMSRFRRVVWSNHPFLSKYTLMLKKEGSVWNEWSKDGAPKACGIDNNFVCEGYLLQNLPVSDDGFHRSVVF